MLLSNDHKESLGEFKDFLAEEGISYIQTLSGARLDLPGINTNKLNLLHLVLATQRIDCLEHLLGCYYSDKQGVAYQIFQSDMMGKDAKGIFQTLNPTSKPGDYELGDSADMFTLQLRGNSEVEFSDEIEEQQLRHLQLKIRNIGLALIVHSKNVRALELMLHQYPVLFFEMRSSNGH